jgi:hypothetical protein
MGTDWNKVDNLFSKLCGYKKFFFTFRLFGATRKSSISMDPMAITHIGMIYAKKRDFFLDEI